MVTYELYPRGLKRVHSSASCPHVSASLWETETRTLIKQFLVMKNHKYWLTITKRLHIVRSSEGYQ